MIICNENVDVDFTEFFDNQETIRQINSLVTSSVSVQMLL